MQQLVQKDLLKGYNGATIEPTGTGGGMKLFCGGIGEKFPDITNASRPMKSKEAKLCLENGSLKLSKWSWVMMVLHFQIVLKLRGLA